MTGTRPWTAAAFLAMIGIGAGGWYAITRSGIEGADAADPELVRLGERIYAEKCASCHGANLEGQPNWRTPDAEGYLPAPPHDETGHTWHHPDALLFQITRDGTAAIAPEGYKTHMSGFGDVLSDREIWSVLAFIKSRWPEKEALSQERVNRQAAKQNR